MRPRSLLERDGKMWVEPPIRFSTFGIKPGKQLYVRQSYLVIDSSLIGDVAKKAIEERVTAVSDGAVKVIFGDALGVPVSQ